MTGLKPIVKRILPRPVWDALRAMVRPPVPGNTAEVPGRRATAHPASGSPEPRADSYTDSWEAAARALAPDQAVGGQDFTAVGQAELGWLVEAGLRPTDTLFDLGCGSGRLAARAIPWLVGGHYIGTDVSHTMVRTADALIHRTVPSPPCRITWRQQVGTSLAVPDHSVDMVCAFSVFTHIEHEDSFRYLQEGRRAVRPSGRFVFTCLPVELAYARKVFLDSASRPLEERWATTRNIATSITLMTTLSELAGWKVVKWFPGGGDPDADHVQALFVLEPRG